MNSDSISDSGAGVLGFNTFIYCANNPVMKYDPTGHFGLFGAIIATGAIVGGLLGALSAASTGGNVIESTIEGMLTGALSATCGLMISNPIVAIGVATVGGAGIDFATQVTTQSIKNKEVDFSNVDYGRVAKTGAQTGLGTAVPKIGNATGNVADAVGTALLWAEAATLISCSDIIITNTVKSISMGVSKEQEKEECETKEIVLMLE